VVVESTTVVYVQSKSIKMDLNYFWRESDALSLLEENREHQDERIVQQRMHRTQRVVDRCSNQTAS